MSGACSGSSGNNHACAICMEKLKQPVELPCRHSFCAECLEGWRSKYDSTSERACPNCRAALPATKEMVSQLSTFRALRRMHQQATESGLPLPLPKLSTDPDAEYHLSFGAELLDDAAKTMILGLPPDLQQRALHEANRKAILAFEASIARLERRIASCGVIQHEEENTYEELPLEIGLAASLNNIQKVLDWLGPQPVPERRINAKWREKADRTLLHEATYENHTSLLRLLLQMGAKVDPLSSFGTTPFVQAVQHRSRHDAARILMEWGAKNEYRGGDGDRPCDMARRQAHSPKFADLLETPLGGRRCEIVGLQHRPDMNGKTGVASKYLSKQDRYVFTMEPSRERVKIRPVHLRRLDRKPGECGFEIDFKVAQGQRNTIAERWVPIRKEGASAE